MIKDLVRANRSYRRFLESRIIDTATMENLINLGRLSASGANFQSLKYAYSNNTKINARIFPTLSWAGFLTDWKGPAEGERPSAYIIILGDKTISENFFCDHGIAAQSILLGATEKGYGGCMIASIDREKLRAELKIDEKFDILLVLALGKPAENVILEEIDADSSTKYYRDEMGNHHVPKRKLHDVIVKLG